MNLQIIMLRGKKPKKQRVHTQQRFYKIPEKANSREDRLEGQHGERGETFRSVECICYSDYAAGCMSVPTCQTSQIACLRHADFVVYQ